jgi:hypothetical protein
MPALEPVISALLPAAEVQFFPPLFSVGLLVEPAHEPQVALAGGPVDQGFQVPSLVLAQL